MQCPYIVIFDAQCSFCNASVNFILKRDPKGLFCFASMQSHIARSLIKEQDLDESDLDTIILIKGDKSYLRSEAVYKILAELGGFWSFLGIFRYLGLPCNEAFYRLSAKYRYRIFKKSSCMLPSEQQRSRFLTDER